MQFSPTQAWPFSAFVILVLFAMAAGALWSNRKRRPKPDHATDALNLVLPAGRHGTGGVQAKPKARRVRSVFLFPQAKKPKKAKRAKRKGQPRLKWAKIK